MEYIEKMYTGIPTSPLKLYFCGRRLDAPNHHFGPNNRAHYWMIYLKKGSGTFFMSGNTHRIGPGDMFIAYPDRRIRYQADQDSVWTIYWICIDEKGLPPYLEMFGVTEDKPVCHTRSPLSTERTFEALFEEVSSVTLASHLACEGLIFQLFSDFTVGECVPATVRNYVDEAILFLSSHNDEPITIEDCARAIGLNPSYLSRLFRGRIGITPIAWLTSYRLDRGAVLLKETDMKISDVALAVGIYDPLYFSRCFSRKFGCSPKAYRRMQRLEKQ